VGAGSESAADEVLGVSVCWDIGRNVARPRQLRQREIRRAPVLDILVAVRDHARMRLPFLDPVFDNREELFGIPANVLLFAVTVIVAAAAFVVTVRITRGDPEPRPFRATTHADATDLVTRVVIVGLAGAAGLAVLVLLLHR
jgi:hypothetical protein